MELRPEQANWPNPCKVEEGIGLVCAYPVDIYANRLNFLNLI